MKIMQSKIKQTKTRREIRTACCLGCKDYTNNFKNREVKMSLEENQTVLVVNLVNQNF